MKKIAFVLAPIALLPACATTKTQFSSQPTAACQTHVDNLKQYPNGSAGDINTSIFQCRG